MSFWNKKNLNIFYPIIIIFFFIVLSFYGFYNKKNLSNSNKQDKTPALVQEKIENNESDENEVDISGLDLLGKAQVSFVGSTAGRGKNISLGIARINGKVLEPNEEFSFADTMGTTTPADGFSVERIFLNGEVTKGLGGGLCQVSTVLFQSALSAGLPITERHNHSYTVSYYDVGLDATYSDPGPNLKFVNDTGNPIVIRGKTDGDFAIFEIYGKSDGRVASTSPAEIKDVVNIPPPRYVYVPELPEGEKECINNPQIGYTALVKYGVMYQDGIYKEETFVSRYKPLQKVCYLVGIDGLKKFNLMNPTLYPSLPNIIH